MDGFELGAVIQTILVIAIQMLLPVVLGFSVVWIKAQWEKVKLQIGVEEYAFAESLVRQFVLAAEQAGLIGMITDAGEEKKKMVIAMLEAELAKHNIALDVDVIDALIESIVYQEFGWQKAVEKLEG